MIPDAEPDDAYSADDHRVDWSHLDEVAQQIADIQSIEADAERLEAAKAWVAEMAG